MSAGAGPRHLAFHPDGHHLFVVNELDNTLVAFRRDGERFVPTARASTLPSGFSSHSQAAGSCAFPRRGTVCWSRTAASIATRSPFSALALRRARSS